MILPARMIGGFAICRATPKSHQSRSTIPWHWTRARRSSRCVRSTTTRSPGCILIVRSMKRSSRRGVRSGATGRRPSADRARSIRPGNMSIAGADRSPKVSARAVLRLNRAERELGADRSALVHEILVHGMTMEQVGQRRGLRTKRWRDYFSRRLRECLDRLALLYGFATAHSVRVKTLQR